MYGALSSFTEQKTVISKMDEVEVRTKKMEIEVNQEKMEYINYAYNEEIIYWIKAALAGV